jgi:hypothetical protein
VTFTDPDEATRCGVLADGQVKVIDGVETMRALFEAGEDVTVVARGANGERVALDDVRLRAPILPKKFFHTSGNYREHDEESKT